MTGLIVTVTGWTIRELDATPWPDVMDLLDYWTANPPLHLMVKGYLGIKEPEDDEHKVMDADELNGWLRSFGQ